MLGLDHNAPYLLSAFSITVVVLGGYGLYLRSRLGGVRRRAVAIRADEPQSARNVNAAPARATAAQAASSANGPSTS